VCKIRLLRELIVMTCSHQPYVLFYCSPPLLFRSTRLCVYLSMSNILFLLPSCFSGLRAHALLLFFCAPCFRCLQSWVEWPMPDPGSNNYSMILSASAEFTVESGAIVKGNSIIVCSPSVIVSGTVRKEARRRRPCHEHTPSNCVSSSLSPHHFPGHCAVTAPRFAPGVFRS
jgi:hypothetical protein